MNCKNCGENNPSAKKCCQSCGKVLEGYTINNVTGQYGYRNADGTFTVKKYTIQDLADGKCAVINDGTLDELRCVLKAAFPESIRTVNGDCKFYSRFNKPLYWIGYNSGDLPAQSVKDFMHDFRVGDLVTLEGEDHVCTITDIDKGKLSFEYENGWDRTNVPVEDLTPYYKKGDKAEVVKDFDILGLKKGDIIEFTDDNVIDRIGLTDEALKSMFKRVRSGKLEYDISDRLEYLKRMTFNVSPAESLKQQIDRITKEAEDKIQQIVLDHHQQTGVMVSIRLEYQELTNKIMGEKTLMPIITLYSTI